MTGKFEQDIRRNYIRAEMSVRSSTSLLLKVTSDYPIASSIAISFSAQGDFIDNSQDEWGGQQPPVLGFDCREHSETLTVGKSSWEFIFTPDVYDTLDPGLPGGSKILKISGWWMDMNDFSDKSYHYIKY